MEKLTNRQQQVLDIIRQHIDQTGYPPTRADIAREVWDDPYSASDSTIDVHVSALRRRFGESASDPRFLRVVRGVGVGLIAPNGS